jgi:hypothetical protein
MSNTQNSQAAACAAHTHDSVLALPEDLQHAAAYTPQMALLGLSELLHSHASATYRADFGTQHQARERQDLEASSEKLAYLLDCIAAQMQPLNGLKKA